MENFKVFHSLLGSKLRFKCAEAEYEGILQYLTPRRLTMEHVYYLPDREYMGCLDYDLHEILSYTIIEPKDTIRKYERFDYLANLFSRSYSGKHYNLNDVVFNDELDEPVGSDEEIKYEDDIKDDEFILKLPPLQGSLPLDSVILNAINTEFNQAVSYISKQKVIGVSFEGPKISRFGKLTWICVSTEACVFLFDIEVLKNLAFDEGLRAIFQDKNIEKVIHDCRQAADCLSHLYATEIVNVFDTQVADYIISMQRYTDKYNFKYVSSLDCCLVNYLEVPQEFLRNRKKNFSYEDEVNFFAMRPIANDYRNMAIKNVIYLVLLKEKLVKLLFEPFYKAVDVYLNVLSNASDAELLLDISVPDMIPPAILMKGLQTVKFQEVPAEKSSVPLACTFQNPAKNIESYKPSEPVLESLSTEDDESSKEEFDDSEHTEDSNEILGIESLEHDRKVKMKESPVAYNTTDGNKTSVNEKSKIVTFQDETMEYDRKKNGTIIQNGSKLKPNETTKKSVVVNEMTVENSFRQIDRIYYRLVNSHNADTHAPFNIVDVKPSNDYASKFSVKQPFREGVDDKSFSSTSSCNGDDCSDIWASLRAELSDSSMTESMKKIKLIPAGMSK